MDTTGLPVDTFSILKVTLWKEDDEPCKIMELTMSKPGKHGEAKARIVAIGAFDNQKRSVVFPVKHKIINGKIVKHDHSMIKRIKVFGIEEMI